LFLRFPRPASRITTGLATVFLIACSSAPPRVVTTPPDNSVGDEIALRALAQVGKPYTYGGAELNGFDRSGLVYYIHHELGFDVPRTAAEQYAASHPVNVHRLEPGDLLFFRTTKGRAISHVAIYAGDGRFVHSPRTGRSIELRDINDPRVTVHEDAGVHDAGPTLDASRPKIVVPPVSTRPKPH